jgi:hypothetical protein
MGNANLYQLTLTPSLYPRVASAMGLRCRPAECAGRGLSCWATAPACETDGRIFQPHQDLLVR